MDLHESGNMDGTPHFSVPSTSSVPLNSDHSELTAAQLPLQHPPVNQVQDLQDRPYMWAHILEPFRLCASLHGMQAWPPSIRQGALLEVGVGVFRQ